MNSWAFSASANVDLPEAGSPVIQIAKACWALCSTVCVDRPWIEGFVRENRQDEGQELPPDRVGQRWIPDRTGHDQTTKGEEGRDNVQHFAIAAALQVAFPEAQEQRFEDSFQASMALEGKEQVIRGQARDIVRWLSPFPSRAIQDLEFSTRSEQDIPRMKVAVNLPQTVSAVLEFPPPVDAFLFDAEEPLFSKSTRFFRITVDETHDALGVTYKLANSPHVESGIVVDDGMDLRKVITKRICPLQIGTQKLVCIADAFEIGGVWGAFPIIRECEEFFCIAE